MGNRIALLFLLMLVSTLYLGFSNASRSLPIPTLKGTIELLNQRAHHVRKLYEQIGLSQELASTNYFLSPAHLEVLPLTLKSKILLADNQYKLFETIFDSYDGTANPEKINELALCIEDLDVLHQKVSFEVEKLWKEYDFPHRAESELLAKNRELLHKSFGTINALKGGLNRDFQRKLDSTKTSYQNWQLEVWKLHETLPEKLLKQVEYKLQVSNFQWNAFIKLCEGYPQFELPHTYRQHKKANYFYNQILLPLMMDHEDGLITLHNNMLADLGNPFPPTLAMLPWLEAPETANVELPTHFIVLVDGSASMAKGGRIEGLKHLMPQWLEHCSKGSRYSLISWRDQSATVLLKHSTEKGTLLKSLPQISPKGELKGDHGLMAAYQLPPLPGYEIQIVLITDGGIEVTPRLAQLVEDAAYKGQYLNIAFMGPKERLTKLRSLGTLGKGQFFDLSKELDRGRMKGFFGGGVF